MKKIFKNPIVLFLLAMYVFSILHVVSIPLLEVDAATIYLTNTTDTIGTFRTNVNTSLTNLNAGIGTIATSSAITQFHFPYWATTDGGLNGTSTLLFKNNFVQVLGAASTSQLYSASTTLSNIGAALVLSNSVGSLSAYAGSSACSWGSAMTTISATGASTCVAFGSLGTSTPFAANGLLYTTTANGNTVNASGTLIFSVINGNAVWQNTSISSSSQFYSPSSTIGTLLDNAGTKYSTSSLWSVSRQYGSENSYRIETAITNFYATSTLRGCSAANMADGTAGASGFNSASGTVQWNAGFTTSTNNPTSTWSKIGSSDFTVNSLGTSTLITPSASTTWFAGSNPGNFAWQFAGYTNVASSSEFDWTCWFTTP